MSETRAEQVTLANSSLTELPARSSYFALGESSRTVLRLFVTDAMHRQLAGLGNVASKDKRASLASIVAAYELEQMSP